VDLIGNTGNEMKNTNYLRLSTMNQKIQKHLKYRSRCESDDFIPKNKSYSASNALKYLIILHSFIQTTCFLRRMTINSFINY